MPAISLNLMVLRSTDLEASRRFYELLGLEFVKEQHGSRPEHIASRLGDVVLEIYPRSSANEDGVARIGFRVSGVAELVEAIRNAGGVIVSPPKQSAWGLRVVVADPDGHRVELTERG